MIFNFTFLCFRSEVKYTSKKVSSSTFQRFHCLTLDISPPTIAPINKTMNNSNMKINQNIQNNQNSFPTLNSSKLNNRIPEVDKNKLIPIKIPKMSLNKALERYFEVEVYLCLYIYILMYIHYTSTLLCNDHYYNYYHNHLYNYLYYYHYRFWVRILKRLLVSIICLQHSLYN
jgi:hypothetical protein